MSFADIILSLLWMTGSGLLGIAVILVGAKLRQKWNSYQIETMETETADLSPAEDCTMESLERFKESLSVMPQSMRIFSLSMRSLYADRAVGGNSNAAVDFRRLRDNTRNDAMVYFQVVLPVAKKYISKISEFFEYYTSLSYEDWCENLENIRGDVSTHKEFAKILVKMHENIMTKLKAREDQATVIVQSMENLQKEYENKKEEFEKAADTKIKAWVFGSAMSLLFMPTVGVLATQLLAASANFDLKKAVAKAGEIRIQESAAIAIKESLIPALREFISGLNTVAGFFNVMQNELKKFHGKASKSSENKLQLHYKLMKTQAQKIDALCMEFHAVLPNVRTDFQAIPTTGTDQSYVDRWLEEQENKIIESHGTSAAVLRYFREAYVNAIRRSGETGSDVSST